MSDDALCGEPHPSLPLTCEKDAGHYWYHHSGTEPWGNLGPPPPKPTQSQKHAKIDQMAADSSPGVKTGPPSLDDWKPSTNSEIAWDAYQPHLETAKGRVLDYLLNRSGEWIDAPVLTDSSVGGFAGTRRLRELRDEGWLIETRQKPGESNVWQHRLIRSV